MSIVGVQEALIFEATKTCNTCKRVLPLSEFYWVRKAGDGPLRGQCKACRKELKLAQRDPGWRPSCSRCGALMLSRTGPGRRLCETCFGETYDLNDRCDNGSHRIKLKPCSLCGGRKERFERGKMCSLCKPWRSYAQRLRRFGLTPADYMAMLNAQGGCCYVCGAEPLTQRLSIDHDHALGETREAVRGLLCNDCNYSRLPRFGEEAALLRRAADYLENPPARAILSPAVTLERLGLDARGEVA